MRTSAQACAERPAMPAGPVGPGLDRVVGCGVMGLPFASGDYLALRRWPSSSFGPGYTSVWHRSATGAWTLYADAPAEVSCPRFFGAAVERSLVAAITLHWPTENTLKVAVEPDVEWTLRLARPATTRMLSGVAGVLPARLWRSDTALRLLGGIAGAMLATGPIQMAGLAPNGHRFRVRPLQLWLVAESTAQPAGRDLGAPTPLPGPVRIGPVRLPQRGIFFADTTAEFTLASAAAPVTTG